MINMTKEQIEMRMLEIENEINFLRTEWESLRIRKTALKEQSPPDLGVKVSDGLETKDEVR